MNPLLDELMTVAQDKATRERLMRFIRAHQGERLWLPTTSARNPEAVSLAVTWLDSGATRADVAKRLAARYGRHPAWGIKRTNEALHQRFLTARAPPKNKL